MKRPRKVCQRVLCLLGISAFLLGGLFFYEIKEAPEESWLVGSAGEKAERTNVLERETVIPCGRPIGIYINTRGVMVIGTGVITDEKGMEQEPANPKVQAGDYILALDGHTISNKKDLIQSIQAAEKEEVILQILRKEEVMEVRLPRILTKEKEYKLGIWVREDTQGVGMLTYVDKEGNFGALGHGINDMDTGELMTIRTGKIFESRIISITKGQQGAPGELVGVIGYSENYELGRIEENTTEGIFGSGKDRLISFANQFGIGEKEIAYKQEVEEGPAQIYCAVDGTPREYEVEITKIKVNKKNRNKELVIEVTDPELIELTGGIVQGMSGSPILQNDRIVGAVTHVFVNNPTKGYGIFIEEMLAE